MQHSKIRVGRRQFTPLALAARRVSIQASETDERAVIVRIAFCRRVVKSPPLQGEFQVEFTFLSMRSMNRLLRVIRTSGWSDVTYLLDAKGHVAGILASLDRVVLFDEFGPYDTYGVNEET